MDGWYCRDCGQRLDCLECDLGPDDGRAMMWVSRLTGQYICAATGKEHRGDSAELYAARMQRVLNMVKRLVDGGDITPAQGLRVIYVDSGLTERPKDWGLSTASMVAEVKAEEP